MERISHLDIAKAFGMFMVYYGHFVMRLFESGADSSFIQWKLIYSVHMPFFFFLSGIFWRPNKEAAITPFIYTRFKKRIIPVLFFGAIAFPLWVLFTDESFLTVINKLLQYFAGFPSLNKATWFLVCLFTLEIGMMLFGKWVSLKNQYSLWIYAVSFYVLGYIISYYGDQIAAFTYVKKNFWYVNEAVIAASFYISGFASRNVFVGPLNFKKEALLALVTGGFFCLTFNLNEGPFTGFFPLVMMVSSSHGNPVLFGVTALSGTFFILFLIRIIPVKQKLVEYMGKNTVIYLGLGSVSSLFIDKSIINYIGFIPDSQHAIFLYCLLYAATIMLLFVPAIFILRKYVPGLVGVE